MQSVSLPPCKKRVPPGCCFDRIKSAAVNEKRILTPNRHSREAGREHKERLCFAHGVAMLLTNMTALSLRRKGRKGVATDGTDLLHQRKPLRMRCGDLSPESDCPGKTDRRAGMASGAGRRIPLQCGLGEAQRFFRACPGAGPTGHTA